MQQRDTLIDGLLVLRSQHGDAAAMTELVCRWNPRLVRHACRLVDDADVAWDLAQETWLAVIKALPRLEDVDAFGPWAFRILRNKCGDWIRRQQRQRRLAQRSPALTEMQDVVSADDDHTQRLQGAIGQLPVDQRELIALYYFEGFTVTQIGQTLGVPPGTVKSRLFHARQRLRDLLEE